MAKRKSNVVAFRRPKRAALLKRVANAPRFRRGDERGFGWLRRLRGLRRPLVFALLFALVGFSGLRNGGAAHWSVLPWVPQPTQADPEAAYFQECAGPVRYTCVVDGDTIRYRGEIIRLVGIDAPEIFDPGCEREAEIGARATDELRRLLNAGPFSLTRAPMEPNRDVYDRLLRRISREGIDFADILLKTGTIHRYGAAGPDWCD